MTQKRGHRYQHLLAAMRVGDVIYLPEHVKRLDRQVTSALRRLGMRARLFNFVAVNLDPSRAHRVLRVERTE